MELIVIYHHIRCSIHCIGFIIILIQARLMIVCF
nr:MAG TPA: hypothetical protein [Caudoviricetes sp.]